MLRCRGRFKTSIVLRNSSERFASEEIASGRRKRIQTRGSASTQPALERGLIEFRYLTKERSATQGQRYVPRLDHAQLPNILATKEEDCALIQTGWRRHHVVLRTALPCYVCSLRVWTSMFSSASASVVPPSLTILPSR